MTLLGCLVVRGLRFAVADPVLIPWGHQVFC